MDELDWAIAIALTISFLALFACVVLFIVAAFQGFPS